MSAEQTPPAGANDGCRECAEGQPLSRRRFLQALGITGAAGAAAAVGSSLISSRVAYAADPTYSGPILIVLSLRGGMDGLSVVAPIGDANYRAKRPTIAVPATTAVPTGNTTFGLHPALKPLQSLWTSGQMAAVHAVGTPDGSRSHFTATTELERAAPGSSLRTGWLDRVLSVAGTNTVFEAVQLGKGTPGGLLAGPSPVLAATKLSDFTLAGSDWLPQMATTLKALHTGTTLPAATPALLTLAALDTTATTVANDPGVGGGAKYPTDSDLGKALADAAVLIRGNLGVQALALDVGDWDMHSGLGKAGTGWMADKLTDLAACLSAFMADLGATLASRVTIVTMSEFGRRVTENGSGGVDHGHGNVVLLFGGGLNGGQVHGPWPGLADAALDQGDLAGTTDYRNVLAEILVKRLGVPSGQLSTVFPGLTVAYPGAFR
jgi:uncharacterized protein (DUF1501 family)